jgi:serine/threonine-protein kinase
MGEVQGIPYIAMQYVRGTTLADVIEQAKAGPQQAGAPSGFSIISSTWLGLQSVLQLIERAARALHAAHDVGLVHRDIKPGNIMITADGDPILLDFGLARDLDTENQTLTQSGQLLGTPAYMAPEQIAADREHIDRRADVYGLTVTLFECVTLRKPYEAESWQELFQLIRSGAPPNPSQLNPRINKDLRTVIEVGMERDLGRRYPTAEALADPGSAGRRSRGAARRRRRRGSRLPAS